MRFEEIGEETTIVMHMDALEAMVRICQAAVDCGEQGLIAEMALAAFTAATLISRVHGDMSEGMTEHMAKIHARMKAARDES